MFFGANDLCSGQCYDKDGTTPLQHSKKLQKALDYLQANLPRTLVNLVPVLGEYRTEKKFLRALNGTHAEDTRCILFSRGGGGGGFVHERVGRYLLEVKTAFSRTRLKRPQTYS
jgi:phospholipase B1